MKGLISAIKRTAVHDGDGIRTTVFFKGCPLKCIWCHNPESIGFSPEIGFFPDTCIGCGECVRTCVRGAVSIADGKPVTNRALCSGCGECAVYCPGAARVRYGETWSGQSFWTTVSRHFQHAPVYHSVHHQYGWSTNPRDSIPAYYLLQMLSQPQSTPR